MPGPAYQWGSWRFEPSECRLSRDGTILPLPAKTLDLLAALLRRAPRLVTKAEILAAVWPNASVEEGNIAFHVAALRKVLDDTGDSSAIETVRGRGYRFVHDVAIHQMPATDVVQQTAAASQPPPATAPASPRRFRPGLAFMVMAIIAGLSAVTWMRLQSRELTIAVMPFDIVDPRPGQENFPDGLVAYTYTKLDLAGIKVALHQEADLVLSGQLHPSTDGFLVTATMTRPADGARLWEWSFEVPNDIDRPKDGPDDERSRLQGAIAIRLAEGVRRYLSVSGVDPVRR